MAMPPSRGDRPSLSHPKVGGHPSARGPDLPSSGTPISGNTRMRSGALDEDGEAGRGEVALADDRLVLGRVVPRVEVVLALELEDHGPWPGRLALDGLAVDVEGE